MLRTFMFNAWLLYSQIMLQLNIFIMLIFGIYGGRCGEKNTRVWSIDAGWRCVVKFTFSSPHTREFLSPPQKKKRVLYMDG